MTQPNCGKKIFLINLNASFKTITQLRTNRKKEENSFKIAPHYKIQIKIQNYITYSKIFAFIIHNFII